MFLNLNITRVPGEIRDLAVKALDITNKIEAALKSGEVIAGASLFPDGELLREELIKACDVAIVGCKALISISDDKGVQSRLQRLGSDLVHMRQPAKGEKHGIGYIIACFQVVYNDVMGK